MLVRVQARRPVPARKSRFHPLAALGGALALWLGSAPAHAEGPPDISPSLKKMLGALPINEAKGEVQAMLGALKKTPCGGKLTGCYATESGPLQLYFFTSKNAQQTLLLVVDKKMTMPHLLKGSLNNVLGGSSLSSPIISISTTEFELDIAKMPPPLQRVVRDHYFNVGALKFANGVQMAAHLHLEGLLKKEMERLGAGAEQMTMRAAVVVPIPADLASGAGTGAGAAEAASHGDSLKKAGADALMPEAFVELQFAPGTTLHLNMPRMDLSDATFFINNVLTFGYKGNAAFAGVPDKKTILHFQTPLTPLGAMDLLDFQFLMATPSNFTMEDAVNAMVAMVSPDPRLARYGGGFIRDIESIKKPLLSVAKPLSVFQLKNPVPHPEYKFGDPTKPFPNDTKYFNFALVGPTVQGGPLLKSVGSVAVLRQTMGSLDALADVNGFHGKAVADLSVKLGPLGKVTIQKMIAEAHVDKKTQRVRLKGNYFGQVVEVILEGAQLTIDVPANCVNPFEIKAKLAFDPGTNLADVFEAQGGANVDPSKITGCVGKELEAAYHKISNEYKHLSGYTANAANAELKKISDAANAELKRQEEAARREYENTKNAARDVADKASNAANHAFKDAGNAFKRIGKKKHHKEPDPRFAASVFDWDYYYDHAQDVVKKHIDLASHWHDSGFQEGRQGSAEFHVAYYWQRYLDVQQACPKRNYDCALRHWIDEGLEHGRQGSPDFSVFSYMKRYPDLQQAFGQENYVEAFQHWLTDGADNGRNGRPDSNSAGPVSGPVRVGGGGGGAWSDLATCGDRPVTGFRVRSGKRIDGLQFAYGNRWAAAHGGQGGKPTAEVALSPNDYIVRVDYRGGGGLDQIRFVTNQGKSYGPYGGGGGGAGTYQVTPGEKLGCLAGRDGDEIDQIIFASTGPR
jgi:hypothetical protein